MHISWRGIHVHEHEGSTVQADKDHLFINGKDYKKSPWYRVPFGTIVTVIFILLGCIYQIWHPAWLLFMTIPLYYSLVHAIQTRDAHHFAYPVLATMVYLWLGFTPVSYTHLSLCANAL